MEEEFSMSSPLVKTLTSADLRPDSLNGLTLVDFWASWCGPCRMIAPIVEELAEENQGKVTVGKLNIDEQPEAAMTYRVMSIPTLILFKDGVELERIVGARSKAAFQQMLDKHIV
jgi:thioredoxin 1